MADAFGIFREDSVPLLPSAPKELATFKGKAQILNVPKKALSDVSNTVARKTQNARPNDAPGKSSTESCSKVQQAMAVNCKPIVEVDKRLEERPAASFDVLGWDYDILPKSERLSEEVLDIFCSTFPYNAFSSPCSSTGYDLPEFSPVNFPVFSLDIEEGPFEELSLEDVPVPPSEISF